MTTPDPRQPDPRVELSAWASEHGVIHQAAGDIVIIHGGVTRHHHEHFHSGAEEDERTLSPSSRDECPYPGLRPFDWTDTQWFFGRETLVSRLVSRLEESLADHRPLAVVAPSGAGKSSLLRAGLMPALARGQLPGSQPWPQLLLTPTADPLAALTSALSRLTGAEEAHVRHALARDDGSLPALVRERLALPPGGRLVLVVDQLEELFILSRDDAARRRFIDALGGLTTGSHGADPVAVAVYGLRADVYGACAAFPHLRDALVDRQVIVGPMSEDEVRRAMTRPALRARLKLGPDLIDVILRELRGTASRADGAYETGRLPLLAHALRATWQQRRDDTLTVSSYRDTGGIDGAVKATAEEEFRKLAPAAHRAARQLFLGLVRIGENGEVTRRRRTRADLLLATSDPGLVPGLVTRFTDARLLTQGVERGEATVEVTHEALLWAWPRLRGWIAEAGGGALVRQELEETAVTWERGRRRDSSSLYRSGRLETALSWAANAGPEDVNPLISDFLAASQRQRRRSWLLRRGAVAAITVLALLASGLAAFAFDQRREAVEQRDEAIFNRVAAEADRQRETDPALAAQLDLVAYDMRPTPELRTRLTQSAGAVLPTAVPGESGIVHSVSFGEGGTLATGTDKVRLWRTGQQDGPSAVGSVPGAEGGFRVAAAYNATGDLLAVGSGDGKIQILDASDARHPVALSGWRQATTGPVSYLRFSPDGRTLAFLSTGLAEGVTTGVVELWSVADPRNPHRLSTVLSAPDQSVLSVAFNPMGTLLAVGGGTQGTEDHSHLLRLWDVTDPADPAPLGDDLGGHARVVNQVAFSPLADVLVSAGSDFRVLIWDVSQPRQPELVYTLFLNSEASSVAFSADANVLATGENSGSITLWNIGAAGAARALGPPLRGHTSVVGSLAFDAESGMLASGSGDGRVLLWQMPETLAVTESGTRVEALAVSGDGRLLAAASGARVSLWDISHPRRLTRLGTLPQFPVLVNALAFQPGESGEPGGPGSAVLATGDASGAVRLWDVSAPTRPRETGALPQEASYPVRSLAFDAAGHTLIAATAQFEGGLFGGLRAWDVSDPTRPGVFHGDSLSEHQAPVNSVAAAPDGVYVYAADVSVGMLTVWRTREGAAPSLAGHRANGDQITYSLAADPRGGLIATGTAESDVRLWNVADPTSPRAMGDPLLAGGLAMSVGFSPDGELLAAGNSIGEIRLWRTSDPSRPTAYGLPVAGHGGEVTELAFGPRAGLLVTGGFDGTVRLWQTDPASARTMLCATTRSAMTPQRWERHVSPDLPYAPPCDDT